MAIATLDAIDFTNDTRLPRVVFTTAPKEIRMSLPIDPTLTTASGIPVADNQNSLSAGPQIGRASCRERV